MAPMIIERHYDDEALISLLESERAGSDAHLPSCSSCSGKLESFRTIAGALRERDVWDTREVRTEPVAGTIATLRAFADRMSYEDARADAILPELLAGPREQWMPRLQGHPEWRTAGVVRKLIAATYDAVVNMPPDAVELTGLATDIADHLTGDSSEAIQRLRGTAWRERAYALFYTGRYVDAEKAADHADAAFQRCFLPEYDQARLGIVRALVLRSLERFGEATDAASRSAETLTPYDDLPRLASARMAEAHLLFSRDDYASAEAILTALERRLANSDHAETHARVLANLGYCARRRGHLEAAVRYYDLSSAIYEVLSVPTEAVRNRWNAAVMLAEAGRLSDAYERLKQLSSEMEALGMANEAALNALDIAGLLLAEQRFEEVEQLCKRAMHAFERTGLGYTKNALTALAYIREAAEHKVARPALARTVREYIRKLPAQPHLLFAPAPHEEF